AAAREGGTVAIISTGWDPGLFSLNRVLGGAILPGAQQHTFWGPGLSQGHSDALRRIDGVRRAVQYTLPAEDAVAAAQRGEAGELSAKEAHVRQCWVVADPAEHERIEREIREMPDYFVGYQVQVHFIDEAEFTRDHSGMPHGGRVITSGVVEGPTGGRRHGIGFSLDLERNPDFTAAVQVAYARAAARMAQQGAVGAYTVLEVAPYLLSPTPLEDLIARDV
ncbi:MAG: diaminopimelate dehydrogenase, partial [bacterium]|nr:diaminopimelate dehydrogenase [bacterium]